MLKITEKLEKLLAGLLCVLSVVGMVLGVSRLTANKSIGVIGGKDGPTAVYYSSDEKPLYTVLKYMASAALIVGSCLTLMISAVKSVTKES